MRKLSVALLALLVAAPALATLTETPITWNVIGLNSNSPASGPNHFPVGARVCSNVATTNVGINWVWDSANPNVNLRPGSLSSITIPSIAAGACADAYFEVEVTPVAAAFDTARRYHITASDFSGTVSTPTPRELYVEHLFSQNRNTTTDVKLNGVSVPAGGTMSLVVGNTYTIELDTATATLGYEQLEQFIHFSNTVFQILSVSTTYSVDTSVNVPNPNDKLYADACGWENDPNSPNYRSCVGVLAKAGGTVVTTYSVRIVGGGGTSQTLNSLIYDFSGTSFRYNSDFGAGARLATVVDPTLVTISKQFAPNPSTAGGVSRLIFTLANPTAGLVGSLGFADVFPTSPGAMVVASPPAASTAGCGAPTFAPAAGAASISFSNGTVAANGVCEVSLNVTAPVSGIYSNTSGHLFIGAVDTGSSASGTLNVNPAPSPPVALPPTIALVFSPNPVPVGDDSTLTLTVTNPNSSLPLTGLAFTNSLPPGLPAPDGTTSSCGGTLTISGNSLLTFTGGSIVAGGSCSIAIPVTATTAVPDLVVIGFISATESGPNTGPSGFGVDTLTKILPPVTAKNFSPDPILPFGVSTLTFHIHNPNDGDALQSVEFGDTFPTSPGAMVVAGTPAATVSGCGTPVFSPVAGAPSVAFTGGTIAQGGDCFITVDVTASVVGTYANISDPVSYKKDTKKHEGNAAVDSLIVNPPGPAIGALKQIGLTNNPLGTWSSFLAVPAGTNIFYKITIQNDGDVVLSPVGASDPLVNLSGCTWPPSLPVAVAGNDNHIATCVVGPVAAATGLHPNTVTASGTGGGKTVTATSTATYATTGLMIAKSVAETSFSAAGDLLHYSYLVTNTGFATLPGPVTVTDTKAPVTCPALTTIGNHDDSFDPGESMTCTATYTVIAADVADLLVNNQALATVSGLNSPIVSKTVPLAGTLSIAKSFAQANVAIGSTVNMDFALSNPSGTPRSGIAFADTLPAGLTAPNGTTAACGGSLTVSGGNSLSFSGGSLAPGQSCAIELSVTGTTAGVKNNTTGPISSNEGGIVGTSNTATVTVVAPPTIGKTFGAASIALSGTTSLNLALANPNAAVALSGIAFTDSLPSGLTAPNGTTTPCGGTLTTTGGNVLIFSGGVLAASANCTVTVTVTGTSAGIKNNTTTAVTATGPLSLTGTASNTATVTVTAPVPPTIAKSFAAPHVALGGAVDMSFLLSNSSATPLTGVAFADALPPGLTAPNGTTTPCGGTLVIAGGTGLTFAGGTLAATGNCTITVPVTGAAVGVKDNRTGPIGSTESGTGGPSNTARVIVLAPPAIEKSFVQGSIPLAGTTGMDLILANPNAAVALTGIAFTDTLPSGLTATDGTTTPCGGSLVISGSNLLTFTGGTVAAAGTCTISVPVTGVAAGVQNNTTSAVTATGPVPLTGTTSNTSAVTVTPPGAPTVHKSFAAPDVALGGTVDMSFLLNNPSATPLTGVAFPDTLPAGLTATDGTTNLCGGTLTITGGTGLTFTGGTLAAGGSCTITVPVTGTAAGVAHNTTGPISSTESGADGTSNTATVTVLAPPTVVKAFGSGSIPLSGSTSLDLTMANPNATVALTGIDFTDTLPAGLSAPNGTTTCGGTLTVTLGNLLTFTGGSLAAGGSCPISVTVTGVAAGLQNNTTSAITSTGPIPLNGTASNTASVTVTAPGAPTITKSFAGAHVALGGTVDMSFSMTNSSVTPLTGVAFADSLPAGLTAPDGSTPACGGTLTIAGGNALTFSGGTLAPGATCTITLTVTGSAAGAQNNTTGPITSTESGAGGPSNTATVSVVAPPAISKAFGAPSIVIGATTSLGVTLTNPNAAVPLTGVTFIDPLPAGLSTPDATTSPCGGSLVITGNLLEFTGGMLGAGGTCTITLTVTAEFAGVKNNTTTPVTAAGPVALTGNSASASVTVAPATPPTIAKSFAASDVAFGGTVNMSLVLTNPNATGLTGVSFGDVLPAGLAAPNGTTATCGGSLAITGGDALAFADGSLAGRSSCTITVPVTGVLTGVFSNTTGPIISTESGVGPASNTANVRVLAPPAITKAFDAPSILVGGTTNLTLRLTNSNGTAALTGLALTDPLPAGLTAPNGTTLRCGGVLTTTGGNLLTFGGGTIGAGGLCLITVPVTGAIAGVQNNTTSAVTASGPIALTGNTATASVTVTPATPPTIAKSFAPLDVAVNGTTTMGFVLTNPNASGLTGVAFTDSLPAGLTAPNGTTTPCGGSLTITGGNSLAFSAGALAASSSCSISVTVTGTTAGVQNNTTEPVTSNESGAGTASNTATVTVVVAPTLAKAFGAPSITAGGTTSLDLTLTNPNTTVALTGLAFTDPLPAGLTAPNGTTSPCGGSLTITGGNLLTFTGGTLAAGGSCPITVTVTGATTGTKNNTTSAPTASGPLSLTGTAASASVTVGAAIPPTIAKSFAAPDMALGGTVDMSFLLTNPNATPLTGLAFNDSLPVGLTAPNGTTTPCGGSLTVSGGTGLAFTGGTLTGSGNCTITVPVTGSVAGAHDNTTGPIASNESGPGAPSNTATVTVLAPPTIAKSFVDGSIPLAGSTGMDLVLTNPNATVGLTGIAFADTLPSGLTAVNGTTTPCGGTLTITGGNLLTFTGGTVAAAGNCAISVTVTGATVGVKNNTTSDVTATGPVPLSGTTSNTATVTVTAPGAPTIHKSFAAPEVALGGTVDMSFLLDNPSATPLTGVAFTDTLPAGLTAPNGTTTPCGGSLVITGGTGLAFTGGTLAAGGNCTITVTVTGAAAGVHNNTTGPIRSNESGAGGGSNTATVTVLAPPTIAKAFGSGSIPLAGTTSLDLTLANSDPTVTLSGIAFTDTLPAGLTAPNGTTTPCGGTLTITLGNLLTFSGGTLAAGSSCPISVTVTGVVIGPQSNTTSAITSAGPIPLNGSPSNTATVTVTAPGAPTITKSFAGANVGLGGTIDMSFLLLNTSSVTPLTGVAFTDSLPAGLTATNGTTAACGGSISITGGNLLTFSAGGLAPGASCTIAVPVTGAVAGVQNNTTGPISSNESGAGGPSNTATVAVLAPPTIAKAFGAGSIPLAGTTTLDLTLFNPDATVALTGVDFTDTLPAGLTATNGTTTPCGGTLTITGGNLLTFTGGTLAAGASCPISVIVTGAAVGVQNNTTSAITSTGPVSLTGAPSNTATVTVAAPNPPTIAKSFAAPAVALGGTVNMSFLLTNSSVTPLTGVAFTDSLPAGLTAPNGTTTPCGGTLVIAGGTGLTFSGGTLAASASCTINVTVTGAAAGVKNNTTGPIGSTESGPGSPSNTATVTVVAPPTITKSFGAASIALAETTNLDLTIANPNATVALSGVAFTDSLPAGLTAPNGTTTPCGGSLAIAGGTGLTFTGGTLAAGGSCTITVAVTGATAGVQNNTTGPISSTESGAGAPSNTATVTVLALPTIAKTFGAASIPLSGTTSLNLVLTNPNATVALSGIAFTDSLPAGLTAANGTTTPCGGSLVITGSNLLTFTGGALAAGASCPISVTVTGATAGVKNNTTSAVTSTGPIALTGATSNTATVTVNAPGAPTIAKSFGAPEVALGGTVDMSFVLNNSSATPLTGVAFSDTLPAGLNAPNGTTTPCGGSLVITGGTGLAFTGGTLAAGGSCTITVTVTGAVAGVQNNTTGAISSNESGAGAPSNTATVTVLEPPTIVKSFVAGSIPLLGTTDMDLVLTSLNATVALSGVAFSDTLPAGLTAVNGTTTPCGGTLTITGGNLLTLSGGTLAAGASCPISVTVTGATAGVKNNTTSAITSTGPIAVTGTTSNTATVTVTAPGAPTIAKSFAAPDVALGATVDMGFLLNNPSATPLTGVAFIDSLPAGLTAPNGTTTPCGGTLVITGATGLAFSGGTLAAGGNCTITVTVTGAVAGVHNNTTGPIRSNESGVGGGSNTATVTVLAPPTIAKAFGAGSIPLAGTTSLDLTLANADPTVALTGVAFTDSLPAGLTAPNGTTTPCGGTLTITLGNLLMFTGGTLAAGGSCPISVTVTGVAIGIQNNTTSAITSAGPIALTGATSNTASVTVTAPGAPTITKSFAGANLALGGTDDMRFLLLNTSSVTPLTGVAFTDSLPVGLTATDGTTAQCGGSLVITGGNTLTFSGGGLAPGASCTITVTVTGVAAGVQNNTTGPISSNESGAGGPSNTATVAVLAPPTIAKAFGVGSIPLSGTTTLDLTLSNPDATVALTGVDFTDALPAGLTAPNGTTTPCGGTLTITGGNLLTFTGGTLAAGASCPISVTVTGASVGVQNNTTSPVTASGPVSLTGAPSNTATVTVTAPGAPTITKSFAGADVAIGGAINMSFLLNNPSVTPLTGVAFSDPLPAGLTAPNGSAAACGGTLTVSGGNLLTFSGGTLAASTGCTMTVAVTGAAAGVQNNTTGPIGSNESGPGGTSNTATVTVVVPPTIAKAFGTGSISVGGTTSLTLTLTNPNATVALTGVAFADSLPSGLSAPNGATTPCGGLLSISGGNLLTFTGGTLAPGAGCTITLTVTGASVGIQNNTTSPVTVTGPVSVTGAPSNTATVTVTAPGGPTIVKAFSAAHVALGGTVDVSFVVTNPGPVALTGLALMDVLPSGLTAQNGTSPSCGGTLSITGGNLLTLSGGTLAGGASCTITVPLIGSAAGVQINTTGPISSTQTGAGGPSNPATVTVVAPPTIAKTFGTSSMPVNGTTTLDFTLGNPNASVAVSGLAFTDALPSGLTAPNGTTTPCGGTLTITGGNLLTFTGGTLAAGGSCTITVTVTGTATGAQNNTTSPLTASGPLSVSGTPSNTATVTVGGAAVAGIPALSPWMLLALAALLALAGVRFARR